MSTEQELEKKRQALINADSNSVSSQIPDCDNDGGAPQQQPSKNEESKSVSSMTQIPHSNAQQMHNQALAAHAQQ